MPTVCLRFRFEEHPTSGLGLKPEATTGIRRQLRRSYICFSRCFSRRGRRAARERRKPSRTAGNRNPIGTGWPPAPALPGVPREVTPVEIPLAAERARPGLRAIGR
jgi:hypothetical protein